MEKDRLIEYLSTISREEPELERAFVHSSYARERCLPPAESNQRLEYLGDAFLDAIIAEKLIELLPDADEGKLTRVRSKVVREDSLARAGSAIGITDGLKLAAGEERAGGRNKPSIVADTCEAVIGALFMARGYEETKEFVLNLLSDELEDALASKDPRDYKTALQEKAQQVFTCPTIEYVVDRQTGPSHDREFFMHLEVNGEKMGEGRGRKKKDAEQQAAKATLEGGYF